MGAPTPTQDEPTAFLAATSTCTIAKEAQRVVEKIISEMGVPKGKEGFVGIFADPEA